MLPEEEICKKAKSMKPETDPDMAKACEDCLQSWIKIIDGMLNVCSLLCYLPHRGNLHTQEVDELEVVSDDSGPFTEIEFWRRRMSKLNTLTECLKRDSYKAIIAVATHSKQSVAKKWKALTVKVRLYERLPPIPFVP